jgi:hypothetical protein
MAQRKDSRKKQNVSRQVDRASPAMNGDTLRAALEWIVRSVIFHNLKFHGNTSWQPADLVVLTVVWAWSESSTLTGAFEQARHWSQNILQRVALGTYQGLLGALVSNTGQLLPCLWERFHTLMEQLEHPQYRVGLWLALAVDGSRVSTPRTRANEAALCAPNYGASKTAKYRRRKQRKKPCQARRKKKPQPVKPQIWLTLIWHMGLRLPWSWKSGPSHASEREHLQQMLIEQKFPDNTLFCADAGFVGYDFWKAIHDQGHHFLIRVGANVRLLRKLGYYARERNGIVYCWPQEAARKKQPPLVLRLLRFQSDRQSVCLVTNVLGDKQLSEQQASELYRLRWGVELQFRTLKQTFGRRKLRCRRPDRAYVELDWSLLGLTIVQLFAVKEQQRLGEPPEQCSVSLALRVIRELMHRWAEIPPAHERLQAQLQAAMKDSYKRRTSKTARYRPDNKDKPGATQPQVRQATLKHKQQLARYLALAA